MKRMQTGEFLSDTAVCIGNFDGVHKAHRALIARAKSEGAYPCVVYTFSPPPLACLGHGAPRLITDEKKAALIEEAGADVFYVEQCTKAFLDMRPEAFAEDILCRTLGARHVIVGFNFTFGKNGQAGPSTLTRLGERLGFSVSVMPKMSEGGVTVSSSNVRRALAAGDFPSATALLGRAHSYEGCVSHGKALGRTFGFPTVNLVPEEGLLLPPFGVYAVRVSFEGKMYDGVANVGVNPTVEKEGPVKIEAHLFDFDGNLYGARIEIAFYGMIRREETFPSEKALFAQIEKDAALAKKCLTNA